MIIIAPSILNADFSKLPDQIKRCVDAGADWIHLDVMDGHFVPNLTFGPPVISGVRKLTDLPLDAHLMIENADLYLKDFKAAGVDRITVHYEACPHLWRTIDTIHELEMLAGVTINPATPVSMLDSIIERVELVLLMTVEPGFGGQEFIPQSVERIHQLSDKRRDKGLHFHIQVDGGINTDTAPLVTGAGADVLVVGTTIFKSSDFNRAIHDLRLAASSGLSRNDFA